MAEDAPAFFGLACQYLVLVTLESTLRDSELGWAKTYLGLGIWDWGLSISKAKLLNHSHLQQAREGHLRQRRMCFCSALNSVCLRHSNFVFSTVCLHFTSFLFVLYVYTYSILYLFAAPPILLLSCEDTGFRGQLSSATGTRFRLQQIAELLVAPENLHLHGRAAIVVP